MGSVSGSDAGRMSFTPFYMFAPVELTKKKAVPAVQSVWEHSHLEMMPLQPQGVFQPKPPPAMPLPSSMLPCPWAASDFHPPPVAFFIGPVNALQCCGNWKENARKKLRHICPNRPKYSLLFSMKNCNPQDCS